MKIAILYYHEHSKAKLNRCVHFNKVRERVKVVHFQKEKKKIIFKNLRKLINLYKDKKFKFFGEDFNYEKKKREFFFGFFLQAGIKVTNASKGEVA